MFVLSAACAPAGPRFTAIDAHGGVVCALRDDGAPLCAVPARFSEAQPLGAFMTTDVQAGGASAACWLAPPPDTGQVVCVEWGSQLGCLGCGLLPPLGVRRQFDLTDGGAGCAIGNDGALVCWARRGIDPPWLLASSLPASDAATTVSVGPDMACVHPGTGHGVCWSPATGARTSAQPPPEPLRSVAHDRAGACGLRSDGSVTCWGTSFGDPPTDAFSTLAGGPPFCGVLAASGGLRCFGDGAEALAPVLPHGSFVAVAVGDRFVCALDASGAITCGGLDAAHVPSF
jgi:hypothetical protein